MVMQLLLAVYIMKSMKSKNVLNCYFLLFLIILFIAGCSANDKPEKNLINIDDTYKIIKNHSFDDSNLLDLNYDEINKTKIIVGKQAFGSRDTLSNEHDVSTQRILCYRLGDSTQITVVLGELPSNVRMDNNMITFYADSLKGISLSENNNIDITNHIDSSTFLFGNLVINGVCTNFDRELDSLKTASFREALVSVLQKASLN